MKSSALFWLLFGITLRALVIAQPAQNADPATHVGTPAKDARIAKFYVATDGTLHIIYNEGSEVEIPKEKGRFSDGEETVTQQEFSDIQVADDRQHIGWLADYMICAQSYPCSAELVIYRGGDKPKYIPPPHGVMWRWKFLARGKQVVVESGFPHGDDAGAYGLYDSDTGRELARFSSVKKEAPKWVQQLRSSRR